MEEKMEENELFFLFVNCLLISFLEAFWKII